MALKRMDIESVVVGGGPVASFVVLRPHEDREGHEGDKSVQLPIRIGSVEATAITMGVTPRAGGRPMTHDLLKATISALGGSCASVRITDVRETTFFAQVELLRADGEQVYVDARPSDAIALAVREDVPVFAEDSVIETAALPDFRSVERDEESRELEEFHKFVENLSPEDFNVAHGESGEE